MLGHIEVIEQIDTLHRKVWDFNLCEPIIRLARYLEEERTSTRHKWRSVRGWSQYRGEHLRGERLTSEPEASPAVHDAAMAKLVSMLRFERWPTKTKKAVQ